VKPIHSIHYSIATFLKFLERNSKNYYFYIIRGGEKMKNRRNINKENPLSEREEKIYNNLVCQINKINRHNRQGSYQTKRRYYSAVKTFCRFLASEFRLEKFVNLKDKHINAYITNMQERGLKASTIKTNLAAIRFYHDKSGSKNRLSGNEIYDLQKRKFGGVNRTWKDSEFRAYIELLDKKGRERDKCIAILGRREALRIHEACRLTRNDAEKAITTGKLTVKGKGGKIRVIPISEESKQALNEYIRNMNIERGQKLFVKEDEKTHLVIKHIW
jgi:site-specific recombinase XerD